jgi:hypothetical protein
MQSLPTTEFSLKKAVLCAILSNEPGAALSSAGFIAQNAPFRRQLKRQAADFRPLPLLLLLLFITYF